MNEEAIEAEEEPFCASCTEEGRSRKRDAPSAGRSLHLLKIRITILILVTRTHFMLEKYEENL